MEAKEFIQQIENGNAKVLTLEVAKELKGKRLYTMYFGYSGNRNEVREIIVGEIVSEWDIAKTKPMEGYNNRAEYWESYMTENQVKENKETLQIMEPDGKETYMRCYLSNPFFKTPTFTCSDMDREVYYLESND